jgi:outer membrane protein OmpA-like peptidoglycan-associated protein
MKSKILLLIAIFYAFNFNVNAQKKTEMEKVDKLSNKKKIKVGNNLYNKGSYYNAIEVYEKVLVKKPSHTATQYKLGETNYAIRDYAKSADWFKKVVEFDSLGYPLSQYFLAASLKRLGEYETAKTVFESFKKTSFKKEKPFVTDLKKTVDIEVQGCDFALKAIGNPDKAKLRHVTEINNPMSDYAPRQHGDKLVFSALRADTVIVLDPKFDNASRFSRLYVSDKAGDSWSAPKELSVSFNSGDNHVGNGMYSLDGKLFLFTKCVENENLKMICKIHVSEYNGTTWSEAKELGNGINKDNATSTHPLIVKNDAGKELLFFSSDMEGGRGGMDIYFSERNSKGEFTAPKNLGNVVNTSGNEITPFLDVTNKRLYFSTDALVNMGGFDIYYSELKGETYSAPVNVGYPLNSSVDDLYFAQSENSRKGFLVSNRPGGMSLKSPTCCDDIIAYNYTAEKIVVKGNVIDEKTSLAISDECIVYVYNTKNDSLITSFKLANDAKFEFNVKGDENYKIVTNCKKYVENVTELTTWDLDEEAIVEKTIALKLKDFYDGMVLGIVYYDYNKSKLRDESKPVLDSLTNLLLAREEFVVRVEGHTDQRGADDYNQVLSEKRAEAVYNYLVKKGVPKFRLMQAGFGESKTVENCIGKDGCPETGLPDCDCHQSNRRTEFVLFQEVSRSK